MCVFIIYIYPFSATPPQRYTNTAKNQQTYTLCLCTHTLTRPSVCQTQ